MAEARSGPSPNLAAWPIIAVWLVAAVGSFTARPKLESARPEGATFPVRPAPGEETVPARLWQDPIQAAYQAFEADNAGEDPPVSGGLWQDLLSAAYRACRAYKADKGRGATPKLPPEFKDTKGGSKEVLILPVFVPGTSYGADVERRVTSRYAVVAALNVAGYQPVDRQHIGYFILPGPDNKAKEPAAVRVIPYEWFKPEALAKVSPRQRPLEKTKQSDRVLLLWIDEDQVADEPLNHLAKVVDRLRTRWREAESGDATDGSFTIKVNILGPMSSNALVTMLEEGHPKKSDTLSEEQAASLTRVLEDAVVYSSWATIWRELIPNRPAGRLRLKWQEATKRGPKLQRVGQSDECLCRLLVRELKLRYLSPVDPSNHVALISEWDTSYGRALPATFVAMLRDRLEQEARLRGLDQAKAKTQAEQRLRDNVHFFSYLRGIDGRVPQQQTKWSQETPGKAEEELPTSERPVGQSQLDYLQRLEQHLKELDQRLRRQKDGLFKRPRIGAIGILGTDNYDKMLILRALRPSFPGVVFFTTDLDACLLHPSELQWTQNLVIASHFGLRLHRDLQRDIPPFRGSYPTALFYAALQALGVEGLDEGKPEPRVYEVGAHGAYDLSVGTEEESLPLPGSPRAQPSVKPDHRTLVVVATVLFVWLLLLISGFGPKALRERLWRSPPMRIGALASVAVAVALFDVAWLDHWRADGEPFVWCEGISVWPTLLLRLVGVLLAFWFCAAIWSSMSASAKDIKEEFFPPKGKRAKPRPSVPPARAPRGLLQRLAAWWDREFETLCRYLKAVRNRVRAVLAPE
jgi:hypothetical protein